MSGWATVPSPRSSSTGSSSGCSPPGLRKADIQQVLGESFAACIPNQYGLVREAIDRGVPIDEVKPGNKITAQLRKLVLPQAAGKASGRAETAAAGKAKLSWAR